MRLKYFLIFLFCTYSSNAQNLNIIHLLSKYSDKNNISFDDFEKDFGEYRKDSSAMNQLLKAANTDFVKSYALNALAINARNKSDYKTSLVLHQEGLDLAEKIKSKELIITHLNMMGVSHRRLDEVRQALDLHKQALSIAEKINPKSENILKSIAVSLNSIGNIYLVLKQYDLAEGQFLQSLKIEEEVGNKLGLAINYQNLGIINEAKGKLDNALKNYRNSLRYNLEIKSKLGLIICKNSIGQIFLKQKKAKEGLNMILPTIADAEELGDKYYITMAKINSGWAYSILKDFDNAQLFLTDGLNMAIENSFKTPTSEAFEHLANLFEAQGDYKNALLNIKKKQEYNEKVLNEDNLQYTADLIVKYDNEKKENQIALLEKENEIVKIKLSQNQRFLIFGTILLGLLSGLGLIAYRQYQLKNDKRVLMLEQQMMRSQMNPHFLFNSLNSIKLYIINNDKEKAVYYLNKFSKLIRTILSNSQEKEITLKEELETMDLYMNIENIRFTEKINYEVMVEEDLKTDQIKIPSLILQPFLENAIWHGLSNKEGKKHLKINIKKLNNEYICIDIIDNGIGRQAAMEIKKEKISKQKSVGIKLTQERLENFAKNFNKEVKIEFEDLKSTLQNALGTKVKLTIPIQ
jgi:tetratricopeptide (TPR) repeat protein